MADLTTEQLKQISDSLRTVVREELKGLAEAALEEAIDRFKREFPQTIAKSPELAGVDAAAAALVPATISETEADAIFAEHQRKADEAARAAAGADWMKDAIADATREHDEKLVKHKACDGKGCPACGRTGLVLPAAESASKS